MTEMDNDGGPNSVRAKSRLRDTSNSNLRNINDRKEKI